jgi:dTDP-4-dehydrorhamnose reductase
VRKLLVTGGAGNLGGEVASAALDAGWVVRATWHERRGSAPVEWVHADVRDARAVAVASEGMDAVVHTAYRQGEGEWAVNADGSQAVAGAAQGRRLIHLSTDLVFDGSRGRYREDDALAPVSSYGRSKAEAEHRVLAAEPSATLVRTSLIYGLVNGPQERLAREGTTFFVDEIRSPVHVRDLAAAIVELLEHDIAGPLHLGGADDISRYDFALLLGADPARIVRALTTPERAPNVSLDSTRAAALLGTRLRGVYEVLDSNDAVRSAR